jgi:hypothetical protein
MKFQPRIDITAMARTQDDLTFQRGYETNAQLTLNEEDPFLQKCFKHLEDYIASGNNKKIIKAGFVITIYLDIPE